MAEPTRFRDKWRIRWTDENGERRSEVHATYREASSRLKLLEAQVEEIRCGLRAPTPVDHAFDELCDYWLEKVLPQKRSHESDTSIIRKHLRPAFGGMLLREIARERLDDYQAKRHYLDKKTVAIRTRFLAKVALSAGYFVYGDLFRRQVDHQQLRTMLKSPIDMTETEKRSTIDEIRAALKVALTGYRMTGYALPEDFIIIRCRATASTTTLTGRSEISYPPPGCAKENGRANRAGSSVFYGASHLKTAWAEIEKKAGDHLYVSFWQTRRPMWVVPVGFTEEILKKLGTDRSPRDSIKDDTYFDKVARDPRTHVMFDWFTAPGSRESYRRSIAVAEQYRVPAILNADRDNSEFSLVQVSPDGQHTKVIDAVVYPSVGASGFGDSLAILPDFVEIGMDLVRLDLYEIESIADDRTPRLKIKGYANNPISDLNIVSANTYTHWAANSRKGPIFHFIHDGVLKRYRAESGIGIDPSKAEVV